MPNIHPKVDLPAGDELQALIARAEQGDLSALPALRALLDGRPDIWHYVGDLAAQAQAAMVELVAGDNLLVRESVDRKLGAMKTELAVPSPGTRQTGRGTSRCLAICG
jgi:hypothetical protein